MQDPLKKKKERLLRVLQAGGKTADLEIASQIVDLENRVDDVVSQLKEDVKKETDIYSRVDMVKIKGQKGDKGDKGDAGKDGRDGVDGVDGIDGKVIKGLDGKDGKDGKNGINGINGMDGMDGTNGKDGKDGSPDMAEDIRNKLELLEGEERLDAKAIKNLPSAVNHHYGGGSSQVYHDSTLSGEGSQSSPLSVIGGTSLPSQTGNNGKFLTTDGSDASWGTPAGSGDVSKVGTPVNNQVGVWTGDGTLEGDAALTFDTATDTLAGPAVFTGSASGLTINTATNGNLTLSPGGSGTTTINAGAGGVAITTDAGNSDITLTPHGTGDVLVSSLTASGIVITDANKGLQSASVATYPSLTELSYVKGVTSALQTQINGKQASGTYLTSANIVATITNGVTTNAPSEDAVFDALALKAPLASPSFTTPSLGVATATSINGATITSGTLNGSVTGTNTGDNTVATALTGTPSITVATVTTTGNIELGHASANTLSASGGVLSIEGVVIPSISSTNTLTNKRVTKRTGTTTSSATPTINTDNVDFYSITAQTEAITSFTTNLSGTPTEGQTLWIAITGTAARAITWGASFEASTVALPTTTVTTARLDVGFVWNTVTSKWRIIATC